MKTDGRLLAVIPARGGSKGLPGKNIRPFVGLPLIAHSILFAKLCPEIDRFIVSTDSQDIAAVARRYSADVAGLRPADLAQDTTPIWPVLRHELMAAEQRDGRPYTWLLLLDPTSPARVPEDLSEMLRRLRELPEADGIISVSRPTFNPIWHCVVEREGWMVDLFAEGGQIERRQDARTVYRINGALYLWRAEFVRKEARDWRKYGKYALYDIPELRAMSIDNMDEFNHAELLVTQGLITLPWLQEVIRKRHAP